MKPSKLKRDLETKHSEHAKKDFDFFKRHERCLKSPRLDASGSFQQHSTAIMDALYEIAFEIAKQKSITRLEKHFLNPT